MFFCTPYALLTAVVAAGAGFYLWKKGLIGKKPAVETADDGDEGFDENDDEESFDDDGDDDGDDF